MKSGIKYVVSFIIVTLLIGCGGGSKSSLKKLGNIHGVVFKNTTYHLPQQVKVEKALEKKDIAIMSTGEAQEVGAFVYEKADEISKNRDLVSLKAKYQKAIKILEGLSFMQVSNEIQQEGSNGKIYISANYDLRTYEAIKPLDLAGKILKELYEDETLSIPVAKETAQPSTNFTLTLQANEYINPKTQKSTVNFVATVVAKKSYAFYQENIKSITNYSNITSARPNIKLFEDAFTQTQNNEKADFLFVIDDSGSMSDDQEAVSRAGENFKNIMTLAGLDTSIAILTTSQKGAYSRILNTTGIIHNDIELFNQSIIVGSSGSGTETGIYNAESALHSTYFSDPTDGELAPYRFPRQEASSLSVVIISDEESQYTSRASAIFDPNKNLFLKRDIRVYSIIDTSLNRASQYDDLSIATGGIIANIKYRDANGSLDFSSFMKTLATDAGGRSSQFKLTHNAILNSATTITINENIIPRTNDKGLKMWSYEQTSNSLIFYGDIIPKKEDKVTISYQYDDTGVTTTNTQTPTVTTLYQAPVYTPASFSMKEGKWVGTASGKSTSKNYDINLSVNNAEKKFYLHAEDKRFHCSGNLIELTPTVDSLRFKEVLDTKVNNTSMCLNYGTVEIKKVNDATLDYTYIHPDGTIWDTGTLSFSAQ